MGTIGKYIVNIYDSFTGDGVQYSKLSWTDSPENDALCDGVIYRKKGTEYYKRVIHKNEVNVKWWGAIGDGTVHKVSEWLIGGTRDRGFANLAEIQRFYPEVTGLDDDIDYSAYRAACSLFPEGVSVYFPPGTYVNEKISGWEVYRSNIEIKGAGKRLTILRTDNANAFDVQSPRARASEYENIVTIETNQNTIGQNKLTVKDIAKTSKMSVGDVVFINYGASYFDQNYGEWNKIIKIDGAEIHFERQFVRDYRPGYTPYNGEVLSEIVVPAIGVEFDAQLESAVNPSVEAVITLGTYTFETIAISGTTVTLKNHEVTEGTVIPAGTKLYKASGIFVNTETSKSHSISSNIRVSNLTAIGQRKGLVCDNTYDAIFEDCSFQRIEGGGFTGGLAMEFDCSRFIKLIRCDFIADPVIASQLSRSSVELEFDNCYSNVSIDFTEFCSSCVVRDSIIYRENPETITNSAIIGIGNSCNNIQIIDNKLYGKNLSSGVGNSDIQAFPQSTNNGNTITGNIFYLTSVGTAIIGSGGDTKVSGNQIYGTFGKCFAFSGRTEFQSGFDHKIRVTDNLITGFFTYVAGIRSGLFIENNQFRNLNESDSSVWGNILSNSADGVTEVSDTVLRDNTFIGFHFYEDSVRLLTPTDDSCDFTNNRFINTRNTDEQDFVYDFKARVNKQLVPVRYSGINTVEMAKMRYESSVTNAGGTITETERKAINKFLDVVYKYKLQDKIIKFNPFVGDVKAALVPAFGMEYPVGTHLGETDQMLFGLSEADFSPTLGWTSDGTKRLDIINRYYLNYGDIGLFAQVTDGFDTAGEMVMGSNMLGVIIGRHSNGNIQTINRTFGAGAAGNQTGFLLSCNTESGAKNTDLTDRNGAVYVRTEPVTTDIETNARSAGAFYALGLESGSGLTGSIGCYGIIKYVTEYEARVIHAAVGQLMLDLGRPTPLMSYPLPPIIDGGGLQDITGLITEGTNVAITGEGTVESPYVISAAGGGTATSVKPKFITATLSDLGVSTFDEVTSEIVAAYLAGLNLPVEANELCVLEILDNAVQMYTVQWTVPAPERYNRINDDNTWPKRFWHNGVEYLIQNSATFTDDQAGYNAFFDAMVDTLNTIPNLHASIIDYGVVTDYGQRAILRLTATFSSEFRLYYQANELKEIAAEINTDFITFRNRYYWSNEPPPPTGASSTYNYYYYDNITEVDTQLLLADYLVP